MDILFKVIQVAHPEEETDVWTIRKAAMVLLKDMSTPFSNEILSFAKAKLNSFCSDQSENKEHDLLLAISVAPVLRQDLSFLQQVTSKASIVAAESV